MNKKYHLKILFILSILAGCTPSPPNHNFHKKVYWLIPDGLRSDGETLDLLKMMRSKQLPHLQSILSQSTYLTSVPDFPNHSSVNFASIVTGVSPSKHGITDNFIGNLDERMSNQASWGFDYSALKATPFWENYKERSLLAFMPQTPTRGGAHTRWIGERFSSGIRRLKSFWIHYDQKFELLKECEAHPVQCHSSVFFATKDAQIAQTYHAETPLGDIQIKKINDQIIIELQNETLTPLQWTSDKKAFFIAGTIDKDNLRVRVVINQNLFHSPELSENRSFSQVLGSPLIDYPGNNPSALEYESNDDNIFLTELDLAIDSHKKLATVLATSLAKDFDLVMHSMYFPNMALTRKWHDDHKNLNELKDGGEVPEHLLNIYKGVDEVVGVIIQNLPKDAALIISSDHGVVAIETDFLPNKVLNDLNLLTINSTSQISKELIDWSKTKAIFLNSSSIYLNQNIDPDTKRTIQEEFKKIKFKGQQVVKELIAHSDHELRLVLNEGFHLSEEISSDSAFKETSVGGAKEAFSESIGALRTPMIIYWKNHKGSVLEKTIHTHEQLKYAMELINEKN